MQYSAATIFFTYLPTRLHSIIVPICIAEVRAVSKITFFLLFLFPVMFSLR